MSEVPTGLRQALWRRANAAVDSVRCLTSGSVGPLEPSSLRPTWKEASASQRLICEKILSRWSEWSDVFQGAPEASTACARLLGPVSVGYGGLEEMKEEKGLLDSKGRPRLPKGALCDVDVDELALPPPGSSTVALVSVSPEAKAYFDEMTSRMLRGADDFDSRAHASQRVYQDASLRSKAARLHLARRLWEAGALEFTSECVETLSLFGVVKKYDEEGRCSIRPVWDERRANHRWLPPPFVPLGSPMCFCHLDLSDLKKDEAIFHVAADIPDIFTRLRTRQCAWPYFVIKGIHPKEFADYLEEKGLKATVPKGARYVAVSVLVMGWSWAPFLAHSALLALLDVAHGKDAALRRFVYGSPVPQFSADNHEDQVTWGYIDDFGAAQIGKRKDGLPQGLAEWRERSRQALADVGLPVHKETQGEGVEALGAVVTQDPCRVGVTKEKVLLLVLATEQATRTGLTSIRVVERLLGLWGWVILFARPALSIVSQCYHFTRGGDRSKVRRLPAEVVRELRCLCALAPFFSTDLSLSWLCKVYATDSSNEGYGVTSTQSTLDEIREEARYCELRGWTACMEDLYGNVEESLASDSVPGQSEDLEDCILSASPLPPLRTKSGFCICSAGSEGRATWNGG